MKTKLKNLAGWALGALLGVFGAASASAATVEVSGLEYGPDSAKPSLGNITFAVTSDVGGTNLVFEVAAYSKDRDAYFTDGDISVDGGNIFTQDVQKAYGTAGSTLEVNLVWRWQEHNPDLDWNDVVIEVTAKVQGEDVAVKCQNGTFVGVRDSASGVVAFKSVPYAKPPTRENNLRWKPPVRPDDSDAVFSARHFGPAAAQTRSEGEVASYGPLSEDCLKLSIWTADGFTPTTKRPVMFYVHGGSYGWGGMCDPLYDGDRLVKDNPDVILVSCDYRLNAFGYLDLTELPGYDPARHGDYDQAGNLGILDLQAGLKWVKENIEKFGGDPENVTIFGESAGGGSVSCLLQAKGSEGLFQRAIVMSGTVDLTDSPVTYKNSNQAYCLMKAAGKETIDGLLECTTEELLAALNTPLDDPRLATVRHIRPREGLPTVAGLNNRPMCDDVRGIVASDPFAAFATNAIAKDVDVMIGTTSEEMNYWATLMHGVSREGIPSAEDPLGYYYCSFLNNWVDRAQTLYARVGNPTNITEFLEGPGASHPFDSDERYNLGGLYPNIWGRTELASELAFRIPSIIMAERHLELVANTEGSGKTYMYYFCRPWKSIEMPWKGACHASELTSVFKTLNLDVDGGEDAKKTLADNMSGAFVAFAKTGNPGVNWAEYDTTDRKTTVIGKKGDFEDAELRIENDPDGDQRKLLQGDYLRYHEEKLRSGDATASWHGLRHIAPYLHEIWYDDYVYCPDASCFTTGFVSACSSVRKGNFHGRSMDYFLWDAPEFVVHVAAKPSVGRLASVGVARQSAMRESGVLAGIYRESYETLPNWIQDGINEKHVVVNCNVVPRFDCGELPLENPDPNSTLSLHVVEIPRYVLDYATNAAHAVELLQDRILFGSGGGNYLLHFMVSDPKETIVIEIIHGKVVARRQEIMTNFNVNWDNARQRPVTDADGWERDRFWSIDKFERGKTDVGALTNLYTSCAMGIERYGELLANYDACGPSLDDMMNLVKRVKYSQMYDKNLPHFWYSEWCEYDEKIRNEDFYSTDWSWGDGSKLDEWIQSGLEDAAYDLADLERARTNLTKRSETWITGHACAYDIEKRMFRMISQEDYDHTYDFYLVPPAKVSLPAGVRGYTYVVSNLTAGAEVKAKGEGEVGGAAYELPIGAKVAIYAAPAEGYIVSGTNPYVIEEVTAETTLKDVMLPLAVQPVAADTVVYGTIRTAEKGNSVAEAVAIKDGKYVYVGDEVGVAAFIEEGVTEVIDHRGKGMVMPGCTDGHSHYLNTFAMGNMKGGVLFDTKDDKNVVLQKLKVAAQAASTAEKKTLCGFGWALSRLNTDRPTLDELDGITLGVSTVIFDSSGHHAFCNSECLRRCGIIDGKGGVLIKEIDGGLLELDKDGYPTGYLNERVTGYLTRMGGIDADELIDDDVAEDAIRKSQELLLSTGYTSALDGWSNNLHPSKFYEAAHRLDTNDVLKLVLSMTYEVEPWQTDMPEQIKYLEGLNETNRTRHVRPEYLKVFMDGVVESRTGAIVKSYKDGMDYNSFWSVDRLADITRTCNDKGLTVHTHTMGDAAVRDTVDAYIQGGNGTQRNCLVHIRNVRQEDFRRIAENNIACTAGLTWHAGDEAQNEFLSGFLDDEYVYHAYPVKSFFDVGIKASGHSDYPANKPCPQDPFGMMHVAVTGMLPIPDEGDEPYDTNELITVEQAFQALTLNGAWQLGLENERGSIAVGKYADFVLADQDVFTCEKTDIGKTKVVSTWFEGEMVYLAPVPPVQSEAFGEVKYPKANASTGLVREGSTVTWKAKAGEGYVFAGWVWTNGAPAASFGLLSENERKSPTLKLKVAAGEQVRPTDVAAVWYRIDEDLLGAVTLTPTNLVTESKSYVTASVSGLPSGLKFDKKTLKITGTARNDGTKTVKVSVKNASGYMFKQSFILTVEGGAVTEIVPADDEVRTGVAVMLWCDPAMGTVRKSAVYALGQDGTKKVSVSASAAKGYVFAGWYEDQAFTTPATFWTGTGANVKPKDYREASQSITVTGPTRLFARFVEKSAAADPITHLRFLGAGYCGASPTDDVETWYQGVALPTNCTIAFGSASLPTVTVSGLPAGVKIDKVSRCFTGVPTAASTDKKPFFEVKVTVKNRSLTTNVVKKVEVKPLPAWAIGNFDGYHMEGGATNGTFAATVGKTGKVSGKTAGGLAATTFSAKNFSEVFTLDGSNLVYAADVTVKYTVVREKFEQTDTLYLMKNAATGLGTIGGGDVFGNGCEGVQRAWDRKADETIGFNAFPAFDTTALKAPVKIPGAELTLKFGAKGKVTLGGTVDGVRASGTTYVLPTAWMDEGRTNLIAQTCVYVAPKSGFDGFCAVYDVFLSVGEDGKFESAVLDDE